MASRKSSASNTADKIFKRICRLSASFRSRMRSSPQVSPLATGERRRKRVCCARTPQRRQGPPGTHRPKTRRADLCRLRSQARCACQGARSFAALRDRQACRGVWCGRRSRSWQAATDGRHRFGKSRPGHRHRRQSAQRRCRRHSRGHHRERARRDEIGDRREAIRTAIAELRPGDVLLVAGKGHETGQIIGDRIVPFSDHEAVASALKELAA